MPAAGLTELQHVLVKVETTELTDATPTGADALQLAEPATLSWGAERLNPRDRLFNGTIDNDTGIQPGALFGEVRGKIWLRGAGAAYSASVKPEADPILQALGMLVTTSFGVGTESYKYDTASTGTKTVTVYGFETLESGVFVKHILLGARATAVDISADAAGAAVLDFTLRGVWASGPTDAVDIAATYKTPVPPIFGGAGSWSLGATTPVVRSAKVGYQNALKPRFNANAATAGIIGLAGYLVTRRTLTWGAVVEESTVAAFDLHGPFKNATEQALVFKVAGGAGAQYNRLTVNMDKAVLTEPPAQGDEDGLRTFTLTGKASPRGTNRLQLVFD